MKRRALEAEVKGERVVVHLREKKDHEIKELECQVARGVEEGKREGNMERMRLIEKSARMYGCCPTDSSTSHTGGRCGPSPQRLS